MKSREEVIIQRRKRKSYFKRSLPLYLMLLVPMTYILLFKYAPLYGLIIAFKNTMYFRVLLPALGLHLIILRKHLLQESFGMQLKTH